MKKRCRMAPSLNPSLLLCLSAMIGVSGMPGRGGGHPRALMPTRRCMLVRRLIPSRRRPDEGVSEKMGIAPQGGPGETAREGWTGGRLLGSLAYPLAEKWGGVRAG